MSVVTRAPGADAAIADTDASGTRNKHRIASIDIVRGIVMLLMAIDHVRVYSGLPAGGPTAGIFFTRWVTHFVAPAFIFLAGTAAFLHGRRLANRNALARFLLTRGLWLVLLELTVIRVAWTFNFDFGNYLLAGVIWVIGLCMILMAGLIYLPIRVLAVFGIAVIAGHNITNLFPGLQAALWQSPNAWFWSLLYLGGGFRLGANGPPLAVLYSVVPWIGVMAAGYAFGTVMLLTPERRRAICIRLGLAATLAFVLLRALDVYGDPRRWRTPPQPRTAQVQTSNVAAHGIPVQTSRTPQIATSTTVANIAPVQNAQRRPATPAALRFLGTTKYPASLLFLLMTLGPTILAVGLLEHARGRTASVLSVFGRVPFFYYMLHIPVIHAAACVVSLLRTAGIDAWLFANHPMMPPEPPPGYTYSLGLLYLVTVIVVVLLYFPCRWMADLKSRSRANWLSYL